jgi:hypothetical protein
MSLGGLSLWQVADWDPEVWIQDLNMSQGPPLTEAARIARAEAIERYKTDPFRSGKDVVRGAPVPLWGLDRGIRPGRRMADIPKVITAHIRPKGEPEPMSFNLGGFLNNAGRVLTGQPMQFPGNQGGFVGPVAPTAMAPVPLATGFLPAVVGAGRAAGRIIGRGRLSRGARTARDVVIGGVAGEIIGSGVDRAMSGGNGQVSGGVMTTAQKRTEILEWAAIYVGLKRVRARDLQKMAQLVGWDYTADYYGLSALEVGFVVANMPKRRRRGITAADVRRVRSTARKFDTLKRSLTGIGGTTRRRSYRSSSSKASASCR